MSLRDTTVTTLLALIFTPLLLVCMGVTRAQVMQSPSYHIESDSINFGGGLSSSTNYNIESTAGEVATGVSGSASFNLRAGYQQMTASFISMTAADSVNMAPSIPGVSGGVSNGSTAVTVTTDSFAGYELSINAVQSPAMQKEGDTIADYVPVGAIPDFDFITSANEAHFGYSPDSIDKVLRFKNNGTACNEVGTETTDKCWDGLSITPEVIARRTSGNTPNGSETTINFRVGIGSDVTQTGGIYVATTTLTALSL